MTMTMAEMTLSPTKKKKGRLVRGEASQDKKGQLLLTSPSQQKRKKIMYIHEN